METMESAEELPRQNLKALASLQGPHLLNKRLVVVQGRFLRMVAYGFETKCTRPLSPVVLCLSFSAYARYILAFEQRTIIGVPSAAPFT